MKTVFFLLLLCVQPLALANGTSGNELNRNLNQHPENFYAAGFSLGYVSALADQQSTAISKIVAQIAQDESSSPSQKRAKLEQAYEMLKGSFICFPGGTTVGQLHAVVKNWLAANPARWNESASALVLDAFRGSFPCKSANDLLK